MVRYYEIRANREAWGTSVVIHAWLFALLLFIPAIKAPVEPLADPLELTFIDLGPPGDRHVAEDTRPAPRRAPIARVREAPVRTVREPRPAAVREARVPAAPRPEPIAPIQQVREPDLAALTAERSRRAAVEEERRRELAESAGARTAYTGSGDQDAPPPPGGAVGTGRGASGDLSGRRVLQTFKPPYPRSALVRHSEGLVVARIRVAPDGHVSSAQIIRSAGDPDIDQAALSAFGQWRFSPLPEGVPSVDQAGDVRMTFELQ